MSKQDTREQLEADMERLIEDAMSYGWKQQPRISADAICLLDRQAAITSTEWCWSNDALEDELKRKEAEVAELTATCDALREQREHWFDEAVTIYRRFYPHDEYGIPQNIAEMVLAKVDELQATNKPNSQFDVLKTAETAENATSKNEIHNFDDSREQLERCLRVFMGLPIDEEPDPTTSGVYYNILGLLDRQAVITEREVKLRELYRFEKNHRASIDKTEEVNRNLNDRIAELTAERDELRERLDAMKAVLDKWVKSTVGIELPDCQITEFQSKDKDRRIAELTAERDDLRRITEELEKRNGELLEGRAHWIDQAISIYRRFYPHDGYAVPADVCSMVIAKIDELEAERDELQAALKRERVEWESERDYANQCEERLNELTAERDKWRARAEQVQESYLDAKDSRDNLQEAIDAMGNGQFYAMYEELTAEVDNLRKRNDSQAGTIRRLRAEFDNALDDLARAVEDKRSHPF